MKDLVDDFKEWSAGRNKHKAVRNSLISLVWMLCVFIYLVLGLFFGAWHPGWLIFALAPIVTHIVNMLYALKEDN